MSNCVYEAQDWQSPYTMARDLVRRHRDLSTVRAMVINYFGFAIPIESLRDMQKEYDAADMYLSRRFASIGFEKRAVEAQEEHYHSMRKGSKRLAAAIVAARGMAL